MTAFFLLALTVFSVSANARTNLPLPRFVALKAKEANVRTGPGLRYQIKWVLVRKHMPLEVIAEFEQWRKVRDIQGDEGWVHRSMLTNRRTVMVTKEPQFLRRYSSKRATAIARAEIGVIGGLLHCTEAACRIRTNDYKGWVDRDYLWGVYPGEVIE